MAASGDTISHGSVTAKDQLRSVKRQRVRRNTRKRDQRSEDRWLDAEAKEKLDAEVEEKFKAAIETKEVLQRIQDRLVIERAQMEHEVEAKIAEERRVQLQSRRKEQEQRLKDQAELERILQENQKKLDQAKSKQADTETEEPVEGVEMHDLSTTRVVEKDMLVNDDVFVLGK